MASYPKTARNAYLLWKFLIEEVAGKMEFYTYEDVSQVLWHHPNSAMSVGRVLEPIMQYCAANGLPQLTALVVNKQSLVPGEGLHEHVSPEDTHEEWKRVWEYDWSTVKPEPTVADFASPLGG